MITAPDPRSICEEITPTLVKVMREIWGKYPHPEKLEVEPDIYMMAQFELAHVMKARGWNVQASSDVPLPNFILMGVAIVPKENNG
jgi:hypothetical protein